MPDPTTAPAAVDVLEDAYRLPRTVIPRRYELVVEPDLDAATFAGSVVVEVDVRRPVTEVELNAADLDVDESWLSTSDSGRVDAEPHLDPGSERLTLRLAIPVGTGRAHVHVRFRGVLNDQLKGFYRSVFTDESGAERVIGTTQMEPTDARRAFPCWDEPDLKAVFSVTLVVAEGLMAVSNAAVTAESPTSDGRVTVRFADTIPMSTYLVAFIVGPLVATEPLDVEGVPLRVLHVPGKGNLAPFALEVGSFCLRWFSDYYGLPYPGDKCDLVALPDFAAGAMENLGAITFREAVLLVDPDAASQAELQRVADVVAHELAHMWFGDLVTMRWWNGLWLNEAFATFMEMAAVDAFRPHWQRWAAFTAERAAAFDVDSLASTRPIEYEVRSPDDAQGMFDVLTYEKGASVLRMLEQYLGADAFRAGIRQYLLEHRYGNAETTDLWDAIEEASGEPVRRIMDSWIYTGGYPVVAVARTDGRLALTQDRFTFAGADPAPAATWSVPLLISAGDAAPTSRVLLDGGGAEVEVSGDGPVMVNAGGHGFYRVRYSPELLAALRGALDQLAPAERALLVDDTWAAVLAGRTPAAAFLELASGFSGETDRTVWATLSGTLSALDRVLEGEPRRHLQGAVRALAGPALERLGWEPAPSEDSLTRQLRGLLVTAVGILGDDPAVQVRCREAHGAYLADPGGLDPNVAAAVVRVVASVGDDPEYATFLERYRSAPLPQESLRYLYGLGGFPRRELAERTLAMTLTEDIRAQNAPYVILAMLGNRHVNERTWAFVEQEWEALNARFPDNAIARMVGGVTALSTPEASARVHAFLAEHPVTQGAKTVEQHLERLRVNVALREREATALAKAVAT